MRSDEKKYLSSYIGAESDSGSSSPMQIKNFGQKRPPFKIDFY